MERGPSSSLSEREQAKVEAVMRDGKPRRVRRVIVRRPLKSAESSSENIAGKSSGTIRSKKVLVAKRAPVLPRGSQSGSPQKVLPESVVRGKGGPQRDKTGAILDHTVLGSAEEFERREQKSRSETMGLGEDVSDAFFTEVKDENVSESMSLDKIHALPEGIRARVHGEFVQSKARKEELKTLIDSLKEARSKEETERQIQLKRLPLHEQLEETRQERALRLWEKRTQEWDGFKKKISKRVGKAPDELLISRADEYREKLETVDVLEKSIPAHMKHSGTMWENTLRGGDSAGAMKAPRLVEFGTVAYPYPLYAIVRDESDREFEVIRNPRHALFVEQTKMQTGGLKTSKFYQKRKRQFAKYVAETLPHAPLAGGLEVVGHTVFPLNDMEREIESAPGIDEIIARHGEFSSMSGADATMEQFPMSDWEQDEEEEDEGEDGDVNFDGLRTLSAAEGGEYQQGPHLDLSSRDVAFVCDVGDNVQEAVDVKNVGNFAIFYAWHKTERNAPIEISSMSTECFRFSFSHGVILPGETKTFVFSFEPSEAGSFSEEWELGTVPNANATILGVPLKKGVGETDEASPSPVPIVFHLQGIARKTESDLLGRRAISKRLEECVLLLKSRETPLRDEQINVVVPPKVPLPMERDPSGVVDEKERRLRVYENFEAENQGIHAMHVADVFTSMYNIANILRKSVELQHGVPFSWTGNIGSLIEACQKLSNVEHRQSIGTLLNELVQVSTTNYCCAYKRIESGLLFVHTRTQLKSVLDEFSSWAAAEKIKRGLMSAPEEAGAKKNPPPKKPQPGEVDLSDPEVRAKVEKENRENLEKKLRNMVLDMAHGVMHKQQKSRERIGLISSL
eukprot:TRINITY_DN1563_c1_g4_i1.p1 TRINITY_DN1563_c1_g4~~TRINITY_DN1563_c1_g4_i1.p1  ORF type:complete len:853 (-),score=244.62 TRINITY_DN1563_c1_g4_i1:1578-4136(-)